MDNGRKRWLASAAIGATVCSLCAFGVFQCAEASIRVLEGSGSREMFRYPIWALLHFVGGGVAMAVIPLQVWGRFRVRFNVAHRWCGRIVFTFGLMAAVSGVALPFVMPSRPMGEIVFMTTFYVVFVFFLLKSVVAARRRKFANHREWMILMIATAVTPMTQRIIFPVFIAAGWLGDGSQFWDLFLSAAWLGWAIDLAVAAWWLSFTRQGSETRPHVSSFGSASSPSAA